MWHCQWLKFRRWKATGLFDKADLWQMNSACRSKWPAVIGSHCKCDFRRSSLNQQEAILRRSHFAAEFQPFSHTAARQSLFETFELKSWFWWLWWHSNQASSMRTRFVESVEWALSLAMWYLDVFSDSLTVCWQWLALSWPTDCSTPRIIRVEWL